jgi:hypothetical protein
MWPCVPLVVEKKWLGIAYGVAFSMQNVGLALFPLVIAKIYDNSNDEYIPNVEFFFAVMAFLAVLTGLYLCYIDRRYCDSILNNFVVGAELEGEGNEKDYCELLGEESGEKGRQGRRKPSDLGSFSSSHSATPEAVLASLTWH